MKGQASSSAKDDDLGFYGVLTIQVLKAGVLQRELGPFKNKVVSSSGYGRNLILRWMAGEVTYPIVIDSLSVGTSGTAAADSDTDLIAPVATALPLTSLSVSNNVLTITAFVNAASLANGTYREVGFFATLRLISRILLAVAYTKATGEDTLFTYTLTATG